MKTLLFNTLAILWMIVFIILGSFGFIGMIFDFKELCEDELLLIRNVFKKK